MNVSRCRSEVGISADEVKLEMKYCMLDVDMIPVKLNGASIHRQHFHFAGLVLFWELHPHPGRGYKGDYFQLNCVVSGRHSAMAVERSGFNSKVRF